MAPATPSGLLLSLSLVLAGCGSSASGGGGGTADGGSDGGQPLAASLTVHYHRPHSDYSGWTVAAAGDTPVTTAAAASTDGFGDVFTLPLKAGAKTVSVTLGNGSAAEAAGTQAIDVSGAVREAWFFSGFGKAITRRPPAVPADATQAAVYYLRADKSYGGWGLHLWGDVASPTDWGAPLQPSGVDADLGAGFVVKLAPNAMKVNVIVHSGDTKDPGPDMSWALKDLGNVVFLMSGSSAVYATPQKATLVKGAAAHLVTPGLLAWNLTDATATSVELRYATDASIAATDTQDIAGGAALTLTAAAPISGELSKAWPYLDGWKAFAVSTADQAKIPEALTGQLVAVARTAAGKVVAATAVQAAPAIDALFATTEALGLSFDGVAGPPGFALWAPTAQDAKVHVYDTDAAHAELAGSPAAMTKDAHGVWSASGPAAWYGKLYRYELHVYHPSTGRIEDVSVTDPYSTNLTTNGLYSQITDLNDPATKPPGWAALEKPALDSPDDIVLYEGHLRDLSALDRTVPAAHRGKFLALADAGSDGMKHLAALAGAGVTHLHLLPLFDFATIDEDPANRVDLGDPFSRLCSLNPSVPSTLCTTFGGMTIATAMTTFPRDSDQQQAIAGYMHGLDSYNWGYDPFHYGAPEGSYASTADGTAKILEFRQMVQGLAGAGLRLVMDVVYNHTNAAGLGDKSVLDKIVPDYYHRTDPQTGYIQTSSCCQDTATEHKMMQKLMVDTLLRWARDYKVDGFRFDLMGFHMKQNMIDAQAALQALTPASDGVDGSKIYLYGEGWDFGAVQFNARGVNATQANLAGTGIGTFNDRIRDGVRGGGPFDGGSALIANQGFASGLFTDPNAMTPADAKAKAQLLGDSDWIKSGMAANLKDFVLQNANGTNIVTAAIGYNGASTGYTGTPQEAINYVSAHDNQTLWDILQYKLPAATSDADRVRMHDVALDTILLGQGIPFVHLGDDLLRSKSEDRNSYDAGDWFNRVDWTGATSNWAVGLPGNGDNGANWPLIKMLFADASAVATAADIAAASAHFQETLRVRKSSPLFRLRTAADVKTRVDFLNGGPNQIPGLIVMSITDGACAGADLDPARDAVLVMVNADKASHDFAVAGAAGFQLHPIQRASADAVVRSAKFRAGTFTVPARTTAVFELPQSGAQGAGLACNTRTSGS